MMRLFGMLLGSAIAIGVLIVTLGMPNTPLPPAGPVDVASQSEPSIVAIPEALPEPVPETEAVALSTAGATHVTPEPVALPVGPVYVTDPPIAESAQWYAFWSPFRSQIAARGFVAQLQRVTGLDYRVVNVKPGVFEVAFAYAADEEIPAKLSQISAATGLQLPD